METTITLFDQRTIQRAPIQDAIKAILKARKAPFQLSKKKDGLVFLSDVQDYVVKHDSFGKYLTYSAIGTALKKYGIQSGAQLLEFMNSHREELAANGYDMNKIKDPLAYKKYYKSMGKTNYIDMDIKRTLAVRSKYGMYPVMFYEYEGALVTGQQINNIKIDYHYATGCKYYDVRPILLDTWLTLPEDKKVATCVVDKSDMKTA